MSAITFYGRLFLFIIKIAIRGRTFETFSIRTFQWHGAFLGNWLEENYPPLLWEKTWSLFHRTLYFSLSVKWGRGHSYIWKLTHCHFVEFMFLKKKIHALSINKKIFFFLLFFVIIIFKYHGETSSPVILLMNDVYFLWYFF